MDAGASSVRVEHRVSCGFGLCWRHALQVEGVDHVGRNVWLEVVQDDLLPLQRAHAFEGRRDDTHVEVIAGVVQVDAFHDGIWNEATDLVFDPRGFDHARALARTVFNLRMAVGALMTCPPRHSTMSSTAGRALDARRDATWLSLAEISAVGLALIGQVMLTSALVETTYGRWILLLDVFIAAFLVLDLGLPTLLARDGPVQPSSLRPAVWHVWRLQATVALPVALVVGAAVLRHHPDVPELVIAAALVSLLHLATYAPRAALRAAGEARLEAWSKVVERSVMTGGYALFMLQGESEVLPYALVLMAGAASGWLCSAGLLHRTLGSGHTERSELGPAWGASWRSLLMAGAPFALTAAVLPYVSRIEKFLLAEVHGYDAVAVFHVAQMAWAAGLVVPAAIRAALIPALGAVRDSDDAMASSMREAEAWIAPLVPMGLLAGAWVVPALFSVVFPASYTSGVLGADAADLFLILLPGWGFAMIATPSLAGVQAGLNPWRYAAHAAAGLCFAVIAGMLLVPANGPLGAAWAALSVCAVLALLALALRPSRRRLHVGAWTLVVLSCFLVPWLWHHARVASVGAAVVLTGLAYRAGPHRALSPAEAE